MWCFETERNYATNFRDRTPGSRLKMGASCLQRLGEFFSSLKPDQRLTSPALIARKSGGDYFEAGLSGVALLLVAFGVTFFLVL